MIHCLDLLDNLSLKIVFYFFQVVNSVPTHMVGAFMVFGLGIVYCWIQAIISHKMRHQAMSSALSSCTRFILSGLVTLFFIISILSLMQYMCVKEHQVTT